MSYQSQAQVIAWIEMVGSAILLVLLLFGSAIILNDSEFAKMSDEMEARDPTLKQDLNALYNASTWKKVLCLTPSFLYFISEIVLGAYLLQAAGKLNYKKLRLWYVVTATYATIMAVLLVPVFFYSNSIQPEVITFCVFGFLFTGYSLFVVRQLRNEIKNNTLPRMMQPPTYEASFTNYAAYPNPCPTNEKEFMKI